MSIEISVIIPTYNRKESLRRTLASLSQQIYPRDRFEVIVVDDGGTDGTEQVANQRFPFPFRYIRQTNQGAAEARNYAALHSNGHLLVFLDDDILVGPDFMGAIDSEVADHERSIVIGRLLTLPPESPTVFARVSGEEWDKRTSESGEVRFTDCLSGLMAICRQDFLDVGMFQSLTDHDSSDWGDIDLAYRAYLRGFSFHRCGTATGYHDDYAMQNLATCCRRIERASFAAVALFGKHPGLRPHIAMFHDKGPVNWQEDRPWLIARKGLRRLASSRPAMYLMKTTAGVLERYTPSSPILPLLYRWIISGQIFRGYRKGLCERAV